MKDQYKGGIWDIKLCLHAYHVGMVIIKNVTSNLYNEIQA